MTKRLTQLLAILGVFASAGAALVAAVFGLASAANSTPDELQNIYLGIGAAAAFCALAIVLALRDLRAGRAGRAAMIGFLPPALFLLALVVLSF